MFTWSDEEPSKIRIYLVYRNFRLNNEFKMYSTQETNIYELWWIIYVYGL